MKELILTLAKLAPVEFLIDQVEKDIQSYRLDPSPKNMTAMCLSATMLGLNDALKDQDLGKILTDMERTMKAANLLKTESN